MCLNVSLTVNACSFFFFSFLTFGVSAGCQCRVSVLKTSFALNVVAVASVLISGILWHTVPAAAHEDLHPWRQSEDAADLQIAL